MLRRSRRPLPKSREEMRRFAGYRKKSAFFQEGTVNRDVNKDNSVRESTNDCTSNRCGVSRENVNVPQYVAPQFAPQFAPQYAQSSHTNVVHVPVNSNIVQLPMQSQLPVNVQYVPQAVVLTQCAHSPYNCVNHRQKPFWCNYCMSHYMFPELHCGGAPGPCHVPVCQSTSACAPLQNCQVQLQAQSCQLPCQSQIPQSCPTKSSSMSETCQLPSNSQLTTGQTCPFN